MSRIVSNRRVTIRQDLVVDHQDHRQHGPEEQALLAVNGQAYGPDPSGTPDTTKRGTCSIAGPARAFAV